METKMRYLIDQFRNIGKKLNENVDNNGLIPIYNQEKYSSYDGAYDLITYFDTNNNSIITKRFDNYTQEKSPTIDFDFLSKNEDKIKNILIDNIIEENPSMIYGFNLGEGDYDIPVTVKNSKKYKGKSARLMKISTRYSNYSRQPVDVAQIVGEDGNVYEISPNTITISTEVFRNMLMDLNIETLFIFGPSNYNDKFYFNK